jgi:hypothetical protein
MLRRSPDHRPTGTDRKWIQTRFGPTSAGKDADLNPAAGVIDESSAGAESIGGRAQQP